MGTFATPRLLSVPSSEPEDKSASIGRAIVPYTPGALSFLLPSGPLSFFEFPCPSNRGRISFWVEPNREDFLTRRDVNA